MYYPITVVSVGNGDPELLNRKSFLSIKEADMVVLHSDRNPFSNWLRSQKIPYSSMDHFFDEAADFDELYKRIADYIWTLAKQGSVCFCTADPLRDCSVDLLRERKPADADYPILIPGLGVSDIAAYMSSDSIDCTNLRICPASLLLQTDYTPDAALLVTELDNEILAGEVKTWLSSFLADETPVAFWNGKSGKSISLYEADRQKHYDHLSALLVPSVPMNDRNRYSLSDLCRIMTRLRSASGCPWDRKQTHETLRSYLIEEAWECVNAIDEQNMDHLAEELGDLMLQIVFHASIGSDFDEFSLHDITSGICEKMLRRHPHVFGHVSCKTADDVSSNWEKTKWAEQGRTSVSESMDDVSIGLPSLKYASKLLKKAHYFLSANEPDSDVAKRILSAAQALNNENDLLLSNHLSLILFSCVELCQMNGMDAEIMLHETADNFKKKFQIMEKTILKEGKSLENLTFQEVRVYWNQVESSN